MCVYAFNRHDIQKFSSAADYLYVYARRYMCLYVHICICLCMLVHIFLTN